MSLLYRAIWSDSRGDGPEFGLAEFRSWVRGKSAGTLIVPDEGSVEGAVYVPPRPPGIPEQRFHGEARVQRASGGGDVRDAIAASFGRCSRLASSRVASIGLSRFGPARD